jgi:hypothetical protein
MREADIRAGQPKFGHNDQTSNELTPAGSSDNSRPTTPAGHLLTGKAGPGGKGSRRARKAANTPSAHASSGEESHSKKARANKAAAPKKGRKWDADGLADEDSDTPLDYSASANDTASGEYEATERPGAVEEVDQASWGSKTGKGQFVLKDLDDQVNSILASADAKKGDSAAGSAGIMGSSLSAIGGLFRNVVGGKTLTKDDLDKAMKGMEDHLLKKNVAREAAIRLCEGVERELIGVKTGSFESKYQKNVIQCWQLTSPRRAGEDPNSDGIFIEKNPYSNFVSRPPSGDRRCHFAIRSIFTKEAPIRHLYRWSQRRRQIYEPLQDLLLPFTKQIQGSRGSLRYLQIRCSRATGCSCSQPERTHLSRRR